MESQPAVELTSITKRFGENTVVDDVSLSVTQGEVVAMIGPSSAGKSTLLRCVNLLETPDSGAITVAGERIDLGGEVPRR